MKSYDFTQIKLVAATKDDFLTIKNMTQFYTYEFSAAVADNLNWPLNGDGKYFEMQTLPLYWQEKNRYPFILYYKNEIMGFVLINVLGSTADVNWNMGEFFIIRKFQNKGMGRMVAKLCFEQFQGVWEVMVIPANQAAYQFWKKVISDYTQGDFSESIKPIAYKTNEDRIVFKFDTAKKNKQ